MGKWQGKQVAVVMAAPDERRFVQFLRDSANVQIVLPRARTAEGLFVDELPGSKQASQVYFWNRAFDWQPELATAVDGSLFIADLPAAPVVEYCRGSTGFAGRLFWARSMTHGGEFDYEGYPFKYDAKRFDRWYRQQVDWIKANGRAIGPVPWHVLPGAWWRGAFLYSLRWRW